jgi:hypothetical protein
MESKIDTYGIENVNFSMIEKDDDRWELFKQQRLERGFDDSELWNLEFTIAKFILPRLIAFRQDLISHPCGMTSKEWEAVLDTMIYSFDAIVKDDKELHDNFEKVKVGLDNFINYYFDLWD